jgi:hypothetical protein
MVLMIFALCAFVNCSKPIDRSMVIGKYIANHKQGVDILELKGDSTYSYYFKSLDGKVFTNSNRWTFEIEDNKPMLSLNRFVFGVREFGATVPGFWVVEVEQSGKNFHLGLDVDGHLYFEKKNK